MQPNSHSNNSRGEKTYDFQPIECNVNEIEPDAAVGKYAAVIDGARVQGTSADNFPMIVIDWKMEKCLEEDVTEDHEKSVGAIVADFIAFFPDGDKRGRMGKLRFRELRELLGIDEDILPNKLQSKDDFKDLIAALKKQRAEIFVQHRLDKKTNETRVSVQYREPPVKASMGPVSEDDDDAPAPTRSKAADKKTAASKRR